MDDLSLLRLQDFEAFASLERIARETGTEIVLHGGTACRAMLHAAYRGDTGFDLFEVAAFNSDIDLDHSGDAEKSAEILGRINSEVPFASWFRWSVNHAERAALAAAQRAVSTDVPLRRIRLPTGRAADIPAGAMRDLRERRTSFVRNPHFGEGPAETRPDIELYGLMMALNTWTEMQEIAGGEVAFDEEGAMGWIREGLDDLALAHAENPGVAARFWHLLSGRLARVGLDRFNRALIRAGRPLLEGLGISSEELIDPAHAMSVSNVTSGAGFRVPELTPPVLTGERAIYGFGQVIVRLAAHFGLRPEELPDSPLDLIDPALELVAVIPELTLRPYAAARDIDWEDGDPFLSGMEQEFVQFAWDNPLGNRLDPRALTGQILAVGATDLAASTALPVVGGSFGPDRGWVRARLDDLIDRAEGGHDVAAAMLILQARAPGAAGAARHWRLEEQPAAGWVLVDDEADSSAEETARVARREAVEPAELEESWESGH